eukprot:227947_1
MGNKRSKQIDPSNSEHIEKTKVCKTSYLSSIYLNRDGFIPSFTTKTSTLVHGFIRLAFDQNNITEIIPIDLIELIYIYIKNNCTFIIIFENNNPKHSYLHEIDIESCTNKNLSNKYNHTKHIWKRIKGASYCYGLYNDTNALYRVGGDDDCIVCLLTNGETVTLPKIQRGWGICGLSQTIYARNRGLYVIGGCNEINNYQKPSSDVFHYNETENVWEQNPNQQMRKGRSDHLCVFYESSNYTISDKIYALGGRRSQAQPMMYREY